jgi:predicted ATP-grasp superfamily ATP-dependent carboligase
MSAAAAPATTTASDAWKKKSSGFYERPRIRSKTKIEVAHDLAVELIEFEVAESLEGSVVLQSFQSATLTSVLVGGYLREALHLPIIGVIASPHFPPRALVENGIPSHAVRIFGNAQLVVVSCEFKLPSSELIAAVTQACLVFAKRHKAKLVVAVEGLPLDDEIQDDASQKLAFVSTNHKFSLRMAELKHEPLSDSVIVGTAGSLLAESVIHDIDVACLVAPTSSKFPDARSAVACVKALDAYLDEVQIDTAPLEKKAEALQASVKKLLKTERADAKSNTASMFL